MLLVALASLGGCGGGGSAGGNTSAVSLSVATAQKTASLDSPLGQLWARLRPWFPEVSEAVAVTVSEIATIEVQVSASDINPTQIVQVNVPSATSGQEISLVLNVEAGTNRTFTVYGLNALHERIYRGSQSGVTLTAGGQTALTITLTDIPRVTSVTPANEATGVDATKPVNVTFSKAMKASTITSDTSETFTVSSGGGVAVTGIVTCDNPCEQATFTPTATLPYSTPFTVTVAQTVTDTLDTPMNSTFISTFRTGLALPTTGTVNGTVTYANTGDPLAGVTVSILTTGLTATTAADGTFVINEVLPGPYTVEASKSGFVTSSVPVTVTAGITSTVSFSLTLANLKSGEIRAILNWNARPNDLDAHLLVPTNPVTEVYYGNMGSLAAPPYALLDRDDNDGFGPEMITVAASNSPPQLPYSGTYCYYVSHFNNPSSDLGGALSKSGATVQVVRGTDTVPITIATYSIPTQANAPYWAVFTVNGADGVVHDVNLRSNTAGCP
jgi:uncharacterized protein YfaP (DUF2135 family)